MILHYLKITWRNLFRRSGFSLLNLLGLTAGLAAFVFILQYVAFEKGFNREFSNLDQLYRVLMIGEEKTDPLSPPAMAPEIRDELPQVRAYSRILESFTGTITLSDATTGALQTFSSEGGVYADGNLLDLLGHPLSSGIAPTEPYTVALSESKARQLFGNANALGRTLNLYNQFGEQVYTVSGIFPDLPTQSDFQYKLLFSVKAFESLDALNQQGWAWLGHWDTWVYTTILQLDPGANLAIVEQSLNNQRTKLSNQFKGRIGLQPLSGLHLGDGPNAIIPSAVNSRYINFFLLLGLLILAIAWINYVNLTISQSLERIRAIGMQRVVGAMQRQIWLQYLVESAAVNSISLLAAVVLVSSGQGLINRLSDRPLGFSVLESSGLWLGAALFLLAGVLISGIYVAVVLTAFHPMAALKGMIKGPGKNDWVRRSMLIFQFAVSTGLIIATGLMLRQLQYMQQSELGAQLGQVILIRGPQINGDNYEGSLTAFHRELEKRPYISQMSFSGLAPGEGYNFQSPGLLSEQVQDGDDQIVYATASVDDHYFELYNIPLLAGRNFRPEEVASFSWYNIDKIILNETAMRALHFEQPEQAIGQKVSWWGSKTMEVVGVVPDYHHMGLQYAIQPMVFLGAENFGLLGLKVSADQMEQQIADLGALYGSFFPGNPFDYFFADDNFARQYRDQRQTASLFGMACGLAVLIACLGLLGLSIAGVRRRTKEVGIRRVLGATAAQLTMMLSRDYLWQVGLAFFLVVPIVAYLIRQWLQDFAYRIELEWWIFATSGLLVLALAMLTVGIQAMRAALANPVHSLRSE